jgi:hypothetical protein
MQNLINKLDGQEQPGLDECLTQMADILRAMGIEEMTIGDTYQQHTIDTDVQADRRLISNFCRHVRQMHQQIVS